VGGAVPGGYCSGVARAEVWDHVVDGGFYGDHLGHGVGELGVFGDAAADGRVLLTECGFESVAGGVAGLPPFYRGSVAFEQRSVIDSACGKAASGGEQVLHRHRRRVAIAVAGAGMIRFGTAGGEADSGHNVEQVEPLRTFDIGRAKAFAFERLDRSCEGFEQIDQRREQGGLSFEHTARRDERDEINYPLTATLPGLKVSAVFVVHRV